MVASLYFVPGLWVILSSYSCRTMLCDLGAIVYSSLPVPF